MAFEQSIQELTFTPATENGRGFLPAIMRASGHFLYILGRLSDTPTRRPTDNQIRAEIDAVKLHFADMTVPDYMSSSAHTQITNWRAAFNDLDEEIIGWDNDVRISNLQMLTNRTMQLRANLDREILGIRESDPGQSL